MRFQQAKEDDNKKRIIDISLKYNILCPHTAFIGIETRTDSSAKNVNSNMVLREIPIEISADDKVTARLSSGFGSFCNNNLAHNINTSTACCAPPFSAATFSTTQLQSLAFASKPSNYLRYSHLNFPAAPSPPPPPTFSFGSSSSYYQPVPSNFQVTTSPAMFTSFNQQQQTQQSSFFYLNNSNIVRASSSLSSTVTEEKIWPSNDQDIVRHLINLQKFDGLWDLRDCDIQNLCQKPLTSFHSNLINDSTILTTVIVIIMLEMKFNSLKTIWSFVVTKGRKRLTELLGDNGKLEQLFNDIKSQL
jgi:hypothetical protein